MQGGFNVYLHHHSVDGARTNGEVLCSSRKDSTINARTDDESKVIHEPPIIYLGSNIGIMILYSAHLHYYLFLYII